MVNYKISVVVPVYNVEDYVKECIESIINQTYSNLEIILVDDGSTDMSGKICDKYAEKDSHIKVIHKENGGLVSARKAGVDIATGDYITFIDSDDWIDLSAYETILSKVGDFSPELIAYGNKKQFKDYVIDRYEVLNEGYYLSGQVKEIISAKYADNEVAFDNIILGNIWNKMFKSSLIKRNQQKVSNLIVRGEDYASTIPCFIEAKSLYIVHYAPYYYRVRENSIMHTSEHKNIEDAKLVIERIYQSFMENGLIKNSEYKKMLISYAYFIILLSDICACVNSINELYTNLGEHNDIVIYGKGAYGNNLKDLVNKDSKHNIVGFIDKFSINNLNCINYDYIIIAITNGAFVMDAVNCLKEKGIPENKILYLKNSNLSENLLKNIFSEEI